MPNGNILIKTCEGREGYFSKLTTIIISYGSIFTPISKTDGTIYEQGDSVPPNSLTFRGLSIVKTMMLLMTNLNPQVEFAGY